MLGLFPGVMLGASLVVQRVKTLPAMQETLVQSLGQKDPLEKGMETHYSILALRIPWTEESGKLQFMGSQRVRYNWPTNTITITNVRKGGEELSVDCGNQLCLHSYHEFHISQEIYFLPLLCLSFHYVWWLSCFIEFVVIADLWLYEMV